LSWTRTDSNWVELEIQAVVVRLKPGFWIVAKSYGGSNEGSANFDFPIFFAIEKIRFSFGGGFSPLIPAPEGVYRLL
jgi:hypothetical protein